MKQILILLLCLTFVPFAAGIQFDSLEAYYSCDNNVLDSTPNNRDLSTTGSPTFNTLNMILGGGSCNGFTPTDYYHRSSENWMNAFQYQNGGTVRAWAYRNDSTTIMGVLTKRTAGNVNGNNNMLFWQDTTDGWKHSEYQDAAFREVESSTNMGTGSWHYIAMVFNTNGTVDVYHNGTRVHTAGYTGSAATNAEELRMGGPVGFTAWTGDLDEFAFWNTTLSESEISEDYNSGVGCGYVCIAQASNVTGLGINFVDEETLEVITANVTVEYTDGNVTLDDSSTAGNIFLQDLDPGNWTIDVASSGYEERKYFVTIVNETTQEFDAYLLNSSSASVTTFTIKEATDGDLVSDATMSMAHKVSGNFVTIDQRLSDAFGVATFDLVNGKEYRFTLEAPDHETKLGTFTRTTASYIVTLGAVTGVSFESYLNDFTYSVAPEELALENTTFNITTSSPEGRLEWFSVSVDNGTVFTSNITGSPSGGTASVSLNLSGQGPKTVTATYRVKSTSFDDPLVVSRSWYLDEITAGNYTFVGFMEYYVNDDNGLSLVSRTLILTAMAVLLALAAGAFFGFEVAGIVASLVYLIGGYFGWAHWSIVIVIVTGVVGTLVIGGRR